MRVEYSEEKKKVLIVWDEKTVFVLKDNRDNERGGITVFEKVENEVDNEGHQSFHFNHLYTYYDSDEMGMSDSHTKTEEDASERDTQTLETLKDIWNYEKDVKLDYPIEGSLRREDSND